MKPFDPKEVESPPTGPTLSVWLTRQNGWIEPEPHGSWELCKAAVTTGLPQPLIFESLLHQFNGIYGLSSVSEDPLLRIQSDRMDTNDKSVVPWFAGKGLSAGFDGIPNLH